MGRFTALQEMLNNPQIYPMESLSPMYILFTLGIAAFCGLVVYLTYRFFNRNVLYSESFNLLIVMVTVVTAFIIITIGSNWVVALGMVGALSIVRFRAAVKDPLDVGFLFWGVAAGITAGARLYVVALIGTAFIAVLYILFTMVRLDKRAFLLIVRYGNEAEESVKNQLKALRHKLKNKTVNSNFTELTVEVKVNKNDTTFIEPLRTTENVENVVLVEYTGDYA